MTVELVRAAQVRRGLQPLAHIRTAGDSKSWCGLLPRGGWSMSFEPRPTCEACIKKVATTTDAPVLPWGLPRPAGPLTSADVIQRDREVAAILGRCGSLAEIAALYPEIRGGS